MTDNLATLQWQFSQALTGRFNDYLEVIAEDEDIDLETLFTCILADEPKLNEAIDCAISGFTEAMRRPWIEH